MVNLNQEDLLINSSHDLLINAALNNNISELKHLLNSGININELDDDWGIVHWLATLTYPLEINDEIINNIKVPKKILNATQLLIDYGADVNILGSVNETPLHQSVNIGILDMCLLLLKNGALVNAKDNTGLTPLHLSILSGSSIITRLLISYGGNLDEVMNNSFVLDKCIRDHKVLYYKLLMIYNGKSSYNNWLNNKKTKYVKNLEYLFKHLNVDIINIIIDYNIDNSKKKWLDDVWLVSINDVFKLMSRQYELFNKNINDNLLILDPLS